MPATDTSPVNLGNRRILFVGGRHQGVAHMRRLIESCNGCFTHHDGGVEQSMSKLCSLLERADAVLFPVECISHAAQSSVKRVCRSQAKPFVPLRSAGAGAVIQALQSMAGAWSN
jgi:hypothetical protein